MTSFAFHTWSKIFKNPMKFQRFMYDLHVPPSRFSFFILSGSSRGKKKNYQSALPVISRPCMCRGHQYIFPPPVARKRPFPSNGNGLICLLRLPKCVSSRTIWSQCTPAIKILKELSFQIEHW